MCLTPEAWDVIRAGGVVGREAELLATRVRKQRQAIAMQQRIARLKKEGDVQDHSDAEVSDMQEIATLRAQVATLHEALDRAHQERALYRERLAHIESVLRGEPCPE